MRINAIKNIRKNAQKRSFKKEKSPKSAPKHKRKNRKPTKRKKLTNNKPVTSKSCTTTNEEVEIKQLMCSYCLHMFTPTHNLYFNDIESFEVVSELVRCYNLSFLGEDKRTDFTDMCEICQKGLIVSYRFVFRCLDTDTYLKIPLEILPNGAIEAEFDFYAMP